MSLPFVTRHQHVAEVTRLLTVAANERENAQMLRNELVAANERYHDLVTRLIPFEDGKAPIQATPEPQKPKEPNPVAKLIREQAMEGGKMNRAVAKHLRGYAKQLQDEGKTEDEVLGLLVQSFNSEEQ